MAWFVYIVQCADGTFYTGVTTELVRRVAEHNGESGMGKGAKYTKARQPVTLVYKEEIEDRSTAQRREATLRRLTRLQKKELISHGQNFTRQKQ